MIFICSFYFIYNQDFYLLHLTTDRLYWFIIDSKKSTSCPLPLSKIKDKMLFHFKKKNNIKIQVTQAYPIHWIRVHTCIGFILERACMILICKIHWLSWFMLLLNRILFTHDWEVLHVFYDFNFFLVLQFTRISPYWKL